MASVLLKGAAKALLKAGKVVYKAAKKKKPMAKKGPAKKRKAAATPKGKSAGTKDYVSAKTRSDPAIKLSKKQEKDLKKLKAHGKAATKRSNTASRKRLKKVLKGK